MTRRSELLTVGIQYTAFTTVNMVLYHEIGKSAYDNMWEDPAIKNLTALITHINTTMATNNITNVTAAISMSNFTMPTNISSASNPLNLLGKEESFYLRYLPRTLFVLILLFPLCYYWHIALERFFPTRPRGVEIAYARDEKADIDHDLNEVQEEEVVKRWIAQGKVRRSSVSWWNTFVKWVLNITLGTLWFDALRHILEGLVKWQSFGNIFGSLRGVSVVFPHSSWVRECLISRGLILCLQAMVYTFFSSFFSTVPLASLISFVIVPARKRVVFEAGVGAAEAIFLSAFIRLAIPWAMSTNAVQLFLTKFAEDLNGAFSGGDAAAVMEGRLIDEL